MNYSGYLKDNEGNIYYPKCLDTGWITLNNEVKYRYKNGFITIIGASYGTKTLNQNAYTTVATIPESYNPPVDIAFTFHCIGGNAGQTSAYITPAGEVRLYTTEAGRSYWMFSITYPV